jgi:hypothetical protein
MFLSHDSFIRNPFDTRVIHLKFNHGKTFHERKGARMIYWTGWVIHVALTQPLAIGGTQELLAGKK